MIKPTTDHSMLWGHALAFWDIIDIRSMIAGAALGLSALSVSLFSSFVLWRVAGVAQKEATSKVTGAATAASNAAGVAYSAGNSAGHAQANVDAARIEIGKQQKLAAQANERALESV